MNFKYAMLGRLQQDCLYFLGYGNRSEKVLWAKNVKDHIAEMKKIHNELEEKPVFLTMEQIEVYEKLMS